MERDPGQPVRTEEGWVQGVVEGDVEHWRGIPYAAAPVGPRRFRAPAPAEPWEGTRPAAEFGPGPWETPLGRSSREVPGEPTVSEDCLTVNVAARTGRPGPRPVIVFIYGGGNRSGRSSLYPGERLIGDSDVIAVTFNFRVGVLGFLDLAGRSGGGDLDSNLALRDQMAALRWIRSNIAAFGGDPENVTIYGQSAGALAVTTLLASPAASGLFARAVSASAPAFHVYSRERVQDWTARYLRVLGLDGDDVSEIRRVPARSLITAARTFDRQTREETTGTISMSYVVDGDLLPEAPIDAYRGGRALRLPLMIGTCHDEHTVFQKAMKGELASSRDELERLFAASPAGTLDRVRGAYSSRGRVDEARIGGDAAFWHPAVAVAEAHSRYAPTRMFRLDRGPRLMSLLGFGVTHGSEIALLFGQLDRIEKAIGASRSDADVAGALRADLVSFAHGSGPGPEWPLYDADRRATQVYTRERTIVDDPHGPRRAAWEGFVGYP
ncbi:carboxylesterase [Clavibacter michiganensis]|nr:carboxylesterase [Clavibacter michiganensis]